ncbi:AEC family transporter [Desulfosarcina sp.]|uniref:AEC family transporter n=1 Tax=Desulfosarcina sp. TaxID=2027861 RepID=UPI003970F733
MTKLMLSLGIIAVGLSLGYAVQRLSNAGVVRLPISLDALRKRLQKTALLFVLPVTVLGAIWIVDVRSVSIAALPLIGVGAITLGGILAMGAASLLKLEAHRTGALIPCGAFTNIGSIGALICYVYLGENGFALVPIYKLFEELTYYSIGFPIAKYFSAMDAKQDSTADRLKALAGDPFILVALSSILLGGILNLSQVPRPAVFGTINAIFIPLGTGLLLVSIGLAMRFKSVRHYLKECTLVSLIKFAIVPLCATTAAWSIGYGQIDDGLPLKVVLILSSMPVAFNALIPPSIYDLDLDLANACWFFTTSALIVVLPVLLMLINMI